MATEGIPDPLRCEPARLAPASNLPGTDGMPKQSTDSSHLYSALARDEITSDYVVFAHTVAFTDRHMINAFSESY